MKHSFNRIFILLVVVAFFYHNRPLWAANENKREQFAQLERTLNGRLGIFALDTGNGMQLAYRASERFPVQSTFKVLLAADILRRSTENAELMQQRIQYPQSDLIEHSPITEKHVANGLTVAELLDALLKYSDNTAANVLLRIAGGPAALTAFARFIGNHEFRLDHYEPYMNSAPNHPEDTATPEAMGRSLQKLVLGDILPVPQREQLKNGLLSCETAPNCIRAGVPADWQVGDRSGGGDYGIRNDIAVIWPPHRAPIILAIYTIQHAKDAKSRDDIIAGATRVVVDWVQRH
jgi:beta-lactamase class A